MDSLQGGSLMDGRSSPSKDSKAVEERSSQDGLVSAEILRLNNVIKAKDRELDDARKEVQCLKIYLSTKSRALTQSELDLVLLKERAAATETEMHNIAKELAALKADKRKMESQLSSLARKGDKEQTLAVIAAQERTAASPVASPTQQQKVAAPGSGDGQGEGDTATSGDRSQPARDNHAAAAVDAQSPRQLQQQQQQQQQGAEGDKPATESVKALENMLRSKDKMIHALQRKLEDVEVYKSKVVDLENRLGGLLRQLEGERAAGRTAADLGRLRDAENARLSADLARARSALECAQGAAARSAAALKVSETRCVALEQEVGTLVGQLARTSAVAQRVAVAEVKAGCKDEGTVPMARHLGEVRFLTGEVLRLQQRVAALEKDLAVAEELKEQYRRKSQPEGNSPRSSPCASPRGASILSRPAVRAGALAASRPTSAPRRPATAGGAAPAVAVASSQLAVAVRPASAPRARSLRSSINSSPAAAAAAAAAGGSVRASFSSGLRRSPHQPRKMPWNFNPASPAKLGSAAAAAAAAAASSPPLVSPPGAAAAAAAARVKSSAATAAHSKVVVKAKSKAAVSAAAAALQALQAKAATANGAEKEGATTAAEAAEPTPAASGRGVAEAEAGACVDESCAPEAAEEEAASAASASKESQPVGCDPSNAGAVDVSSQVLANSTSPGESPQVSTDA